MYLSREDKLPERERGREGEREKGREKEGRRKRERRRGRERGEGEREGGRESNNIYIYMHNVHVVCQLINISSTFGVHNLCSTKVLGYYHTCICIEGYS